jgi:cyclic beta-1,2-glucan synthetase
MKRQVRGLANDLEVRYLANRDPHLHFALLTDLPDAVSKPRTNDTDPWPSSPFNSSTISIAKYAAQNKGGFFLLHRHRIFSVREGVWMGWERKRGKLLDLNKYSSLATSMPSPSRQAGSTCPARSPLCSHA